jgi:hypothetical protein
MEMIDGMNFEEKHSKQREIEMYQQDMLSDPARLSGLIAHRFPQSVTERHNVWHKSRQNAPIPTPEIKFKNRVTQCDPKENLREACTSLAPACMRCLHTIGSSSQQ